MAAAANNLGMLGVSLITPQQDAPFQDRSDYLDRSIGQMNNLIHGMAAAAGRVISLTTVGSRHVWLGLKALSRKDRDDLLGAPVSTEGLFGSISSVTQRFRRLEDEKSQLSRMLPLALPQRGERGATVRRRERCRFRAPMAPAAPFTSSAGPAEPAQYRTRRDRLRDPDRPRQAPRRKRVSGWCGPSSRK